MRPDEYPGVVTTISLVSLTLPSGRGRPAAKARRAPRSSPRNFSSLPSYRFSIGKNPDCLGQAFLLLRQTEFPAGSLHSRSRQPRIRTEPVPWAPVRPGSRRYPSFALSRTRFSVEPRVFGCERTASRHENRFLAPDKWICLRAPSFRFQESRFPAGKEVLASASPNPPPSRTKSWRVSRLGRSSTQRGGRQMKLDLAPLASRRRQRSLRGRCGAKEHTKTID